MQSTCVRPYKKHAICQDVSAVFLTPLQSGSGVHGAIQRKKGGEWLFIVLPIVGYPPKGKSLASAPAEPTAGTFFNLEFSVMMLVKY